MMRILTTFPLPELRTLISRRATLPAYETVAETARRAFDAGVTLDDLNEAELLHVCTAARIPLAARTADAARAAIVSAKLSKFPYVADTPKKAAAADAAAPNASDDELADDLTSDDDDSSAASENDEARRAPSRPARSSAAAPPAPPAPAAPASEPVPFAEPKKATLYWAPFEGKHDPVTGAVISRAAREANRRAYALQRGEFLRGEYVAYDGGRLVTRCSDSCDLGTRLLSGAPLSPNYFWTVVGAESTTSFGHARVSFCTVVWESSSGIVAELRPRLNDAMFVSAGGQTVRANFLIDTGSQVSILGKDVADRLALSRQHPSSFRHIIGITGDAVTCPVYWLTATLTQLGDEQVIIPHPFIVSTASESVLGMDFLHFFDLRIRGHHPVTLRPLQRIVSRRADMGMQ